MPLAPPFTRDNAGEMARRATISREDNRAKRFLASLPERAQGRAVVQVNKVLRWMEKEKDRAEYAKLAAILDKLWNMAYPKAGVLKPRRNDRPRMPEARGVPIPAPQSPEAVQTENPPKAQ